MSTPTDTPPEASTIPDKGLKGGCSAMSGSLTIDPSDPEVIAICSLLCFQCGPIADHLRAAGLDIKRKAEDEQAKVILWVLGRYQIHGAEWRSKIGADIRAMKDSANA